jgi:UDP-3-O-[3-hydroxymyristoyl] glucosamine N-acyltransferase
MKLKDLAHLLDGRVSGDPDLDISGVAGIKEAREGDITYLASRKNLQSLLESKASAVIAQEEIGEITASVLVVPNPQLAFARTLDIFFKKPFQSFGISKGAVIGEGVVFGNEVSVAPFVHIGKKVSIGDRSAVLPHVYIGDNVTIGQDVVVHPNVTIRENVTIGRNVTVHAGTVIGSDGFGYVNEEGSHFKIPQVGGVIIEDDVEIGANVTIDRATTGNTVIGSGTKIDNLVQIAHNVRIGRNCVIIAQTGIGGSAEISDGVILAGQVGVRDHVRIGKGVMAGAQSGIGQNVPDGQVVSGTPAIPHKTWLRAQSAFSRLPEYIRRLQSLERTTKKEDK